MSKKPARKKAKGSRAAKRGARSGATLNSSAVWTVRDAQRLRTDGEHSPSQAELAREARVGDDTVSKVERGIGVSRRSANRVFEALNAHHGKRLKRDQHVVEVKTARKR